MDALIPKELLGPTPHLIGGEKLGNRAKNRAAPYLHREKTRHGSVAWYVRKGTGPRIRIYGEPDSPQFQADYESALRKKPEAPACKETHVYFVRIGSRRVKIGFSKNPIKRVQNMKTGSPHKLRVYYATPGGRDLERELHRMFADDRINGEWFIWSSRIQDWIVADEARRVAARAALPHP